MIGEQTVADAILDRLVHQSLRIELKGESLRKLKRKLTLKKQRKLINQNRQKNPMFEK